MNTTQHQLPAILERDVERAKEILRSVGCSEIFIFGSAVEGHFNADSDIDLAVRGCPPQQFFQVFGRLMMELNRPIDLIDLDEESPFTRYLQQRHRLVQID